jgi:hypothetical protein
MDINAAIIDQRLTKLVEELQSDLQQELSVTDPARQKSLAFVYLCTKSLLELDHEVAWAALTDGGNDFGVDAIYLGADIDGEFLVNVFQTKYKHSNLDGTANFPEAGVAAVIEAIQYLFDPLAQAITMNLRLAPIIEDARARISDGAIPRVRVFLCNNGAIWNQQSQQRIDRFGAADQVNWVHVNPDVLLQILQSSKPVNDSLKFHGKAIVEDFEFSRALVGKVNISEIAALMERHGDRLLERNIRRYLGLSGNRVNESIRDTLKDKEERANFYFYNNGITLTCSKFDYNGLQQGDYQVKVENLQIINGGQTSHTITKVLKELAAIDSDNLDKTFVMVRLYQFAQDRINFVEKITHTTNSQNPVDLRDLKSNDALQTRLETDLHSLGYHYRRKRDDTVSNKSEDISSATAAEAILSVLRKKPQQAKYAARDHFDKLYATIFTPNLTGAELVCATLLYRIAENKRKRRDANSPDFLPYAACFLAMRMGEYLHRTLALGPKKTLDHTSFESAKNDILLNGEKYFQASMSDMDDAIKALYREEKPSLQRLASTFRRGDLISELAKLALRTLTN